MFEQRSRPALYCVIAASCLVLLSGCRKDADQPDDPSPVVALTPTDLNATPGNAVVALSWSASSGAAVYKVKRKINGGTYTPVATATTTAYSDASVTNGTAYMYVVSAIAGAVESADSAPAMAIPQAPATAPTAPTGLAASGGSGQVNLTWTASNGATSYNVKRSTSNGGPHTQIATASSPFHVDTVTAAGTYYYVVSAVNAQGESGNSIQASVTIVGAPAVPTGLAASAGNAQVSLNWSASNGATSYKVKRSTSNGGPYTQVNAPTGTSYADFSVTNGTTYYYVVTAVGTAGESGNSTQVAAQPNVATPPPTSFGTWINVTPAGVNPVAGFSCGNYGTETVKADPAHPSNLYTLFHCQGVWKSTDYGATWTGPINTGTNGAAAGDCAGGLSLAPGTGNVPTLYLGCIRGAGTGFWRSVDGGVNWTRYFVAPSGASRQDYYPPVVDPYDANHLVMAGHEMNYLVESFNGGQTWNNVPMANGMLQNGGTGEVFFINTGNANTTRGNWLWLAQGTGGYIGTWRTTNAGANWVFVDKNEHPHGASQIYQPDNNGVVFMAGVYSAHGWGVLRSTDYGMTWSHVGVPGVEVVVTGTSKNLYAMNGYPTGPGGIIDPVFQIGAQPGIGTWLMPGTPSNMGQGAAQLAVVNNGSNNIILGAMWNGGIWRYIEP